MNEKNTPAHKSNTVRDENQVKERKKRKRKPPKTYLDIFASKKRDKNLGQIFMSPGYNHQKRPSMRVVESKDVLETPRFVFSRQSQKAKKAVYFDVQQRKIHSNPVNSSTIQNPDNSSLTLNGMFTSFDDKNLFFMKKKEGSKRRSVQRNFEMTFSHKKKKHFFARKLAKTGDRRRKKSCGNSNSFVRKRMRDRRNVGRSLDLVKGHKGPENQGDLYNLNPQLDPHHKPPHHRNPSYKKSSQKLAKILGRDRRRPRTDNHRNKSFGLAKVRRRSKGGTKRGNLSFDYKKFDKSREILEHVNMDKSTDSKNGVLRDMNMRMKFKRELGEILKNCNIKKKRIRSPQFFMKKKKRGGNRPVL